MTGYGRMPTGLEELTALEISSDPELLQEVRVFVRFAHDNPTAPCYARFDSKSGLCRSCPDHHQCALAQGNPRIKVRIGLQGVEFGLSLRC